ncbi:MAG: type II toxin-antitoxin system RelE/ParE family toxin [Terracidiphilus sp.]|jgi:toxin ParE1/3/4
MKKVRFRPFAWEDVQQSAEYLANEGSVEIAERFLDAVDGLTQRLASLPQMGTPCRFSNPLLRNVRWSPVPGYRKWLVFYQASDDSIEVIRILHGARDIASILDPDAQRL